MWRLWALLENKYEWVYFTSSTEVTSLVPSSRTAESQDKRVGHAQLNINFYHVFRNTNNIILSTCENLSISPLFLNVLLTTTWLWYFQ